MVVAGACAVLPAFIVGLGCLVIEVSKNTVFYALCVAMFDGFVSVFTETHMMRS